MKFRSLIKSAIAASLVCATGVVSAMPTYYFAEDKKTSASEMPNARAAQADFLTNIDVFGTESFESYSHKEAAPLDVAFTNGINAKLTGDGIVRAKPYRGRYATEGENYFNDAGYSWTITFETPIAAFGMYAIDAGDGGGTLSVLINDTTLIDVPHANPQKTKGALFWGVIDTMDDIFKIDVLNSSNGADGIGFDELVVASRDAVIISAPSSLALMLVPMLGLLGFKRKD